MLVAIPPYNEHVAHIVNMRVFCYQVRPGRVRVPVPSAGADLAAAYQSRPPGYTSGTPA